MISVAFKEPPLAMFGRDGFAPNELTFEVGEPGGIELDFLAKVPGPTLGLGPARMRFDYGESFGAALQLEAYERLIHDAMIGDPTLFTSARGNERLWEVAAPVLADPLPVHVYPDGSWGPEEIDKLIAPRRWHLPDRR